MNSHKLHLLQRIFFLILTVSVIGLASACKSEGGDINGESGQTSSLEIDVTIQGLSSGYVYLTGYYGDQYYTIDSFPISDKGNIQIKRPQAIKEGMYYLAMRGGVGAIQVLVTEDQHFSLNCEIEDPINTMKVTGSLDNQLLYENLRFEQQYQGEYNGLRQQQENAPEGSETWLQLEARRTAMIAERASHIDAFEQDYPNAFFTTFKLAGQNPKLSQPKLPDGSIDTDQQMYLYRASYWNGFDFSDERLLNTPVYSNKLKTFLDRILPQNIDTIIKYADDLTRKSMANDSMFKFTANWIGVKYKEPTFMGADAIYAHMVENFFTEDLAFWSNTYELRALQQDAAIRASSKLGAQAQPLDVTNENGLEISLLESDAELIVLYIYTPECEHCQEETPLVKEVYDLWKQRGVEVFALCTAPDAEVCKSYIRQNNLDWKNGIDADVSSNYTFKYHIDITPEIYVIDQERKIVGKDLKAFQLETIFNRHLQN